MSEAKQAIVVVAEDDPSDRFALEQALRELSAMLVVESVRDGVELIERLENRDLPRPDLVVVDLKMPRLSGDGVLEKLRASGHLETLPVVVYTGSRNAAALGRCLDAGASAVLRKPSDLDGLRRAVRAMAERWL